MQMKNSKLNIKPTKKTEIKKYPSLLLKTERDIAMDFAIKIYQKFDKMIKSIILFGSSAKQTNVIGSDIDIIIIIDDASIKFDETLVLWYREELAKIIQENPYQKDFHINRVPVHILSSKSAELSSVEGCFWAMVDSAQALLMAIKVLPPSTEHIAGLLKENFVDKRLLKIKYVDNFIELHELHRKVMHGEIRNINGNIIDMWQNKAEEFLNVVM